MTTDTTNTEYQSLPLFEPRGERRLIYTSDPSNLAFYQVGQQVDHMPDAATARNDPARREDLVEWVDQLAHHGIDTYAQAIYAQGWTVFFRSDRFEYDGRPQHQRFVSMMDAGITPLEVLIEQTHKRGMEFVAKFRMNDRHGNGDQGARFILDNPAWQLEEFPGGQDFSFEPVRDYVFSVANEVVERFDVDGLLFNYIRHGHCFPTDVARDRQPVMTEFLQRVREMLDRRSAQQQKTLTLGVMVPQRLDECHNLGFDIPTWIREGLIDYICPCDFHFADFNAPYEEFSQLTHGSDCLMYPTLSPMLCRGDDTTLLTPESYRALAQNFYGAGADGVSVFNYQYHWARKGGTARYPGPVEGYPLSLSYLRDLRDPKTVASRTRHYRYHPLWGGASPTGAVKDDKTILTREVGSIGEYRFRLCEQPTQGTQAVLYFTTQGLLSQDEIAVEVNGTEIQNLQRVFHPDGRLERFGRPLPPFSSVWFNLNQEWLNSGDNYLKLQLTHIANDTNSDVVIDEVEVVVMPA
jgi:hypothetical protein